ncbi:MAG: diacylglycerol kinase family lipid kinase [Opitutus sp.]|nr:diacylglycerol kinase family lipid kinase [Opitutus sp.]
MLPRRFVFSFRRILSFAPVLPLKTCFIINLHAGGAARIGPAVQAFAQQHSAKVTFTARAGHAGELATQAVADGYALIVAVGGDGTMNEIASSLVGTDAILGLVPCGSGDGLGRHLGIHGSPAHALALLRSGRPRAIDSGLANGRPFFNVAGLGFEAEIARRFNQLKRRGFLRYLATSATAFRQWQPSEFTLSYGDQTERVRAFTLAVANSDQYGNHALIAPGARSDDGELNLCAVPPVTWWNALPLVARLFTGRLADAPCMVLRQAASFTVTRPSPGPLHTDGEVHGAGTTIEFVVRPGSLRVMCPNF